MYWILFYDLADDYLERRQQWRDEHLGLARAAHADGTIVLAGALADPPDHAVLIFRADSADVAERFAAADPYVKAGLVTNWYVRPWTVVIGDGTSPRT